MTFGWPSEDPRLSPSSSTKEKKATENRRDGDGVNNFLPLLV